MSQLIIHGGRPLSGTITVAGNKNAVMPCLAASIIADTPTTFTNVPDIEDVKVSLQILQDLGAIITRITPDVVTIDPSNITTFELNPDLVAKLRSSILYLGPLLARTGQVSMRHPGGCIIGRRPVGTHFDAIAQMGGEIIANADGNYYGKFTTPRDSEIFLDEVSVTATENAMTLAAKLPVKTIILGAACEPHVVNLAAYLSAMGAQISGAGTNRIEIIGKTNLQGVTHRISDDYIEMITFAIMAAATKSHLFIKNAQRGDFHMAGAYLRAMGVQYTFHEDNTLEIIPSELHAPKNIKEVQTRPWPGFPTDALSPLVVLATQAQGSTLIHEWMYEGRLLFSDMLVTMGANIITCDPHRIIVQGATQLRSKRLVSPDIRAGVALVIAGLIADGETMIDNTQLIARGYQNIATRLSAIGADIKEIL